MNLHSDDLLNKLNASKNTYGARIDYHNPIRLYIRLHVLFNILFIDQYIGFKYRFSSNLVINGINSRKDYTVVMLYQSNTDSCIWSNKIIPLLLMMGYRPNIFQTASITSYIWIISWCKLNRGTWWQSTNQPPPCDCLEHNTCRCNDALEWTSRIPHIHSVYLIFDPLVFSRCTIGQKLDWAWYRYMFPFWHDHIDNLSKFQSKFRIDKH